MLAVTVFIYALFYAPLHVRAAPVNSPTTLQSYDAWNSVGCYVDSIWNRQIPHRQETPGGPNAMNVGVCLDTCKANGFAVAGLEWSQECWCGDSIPPQQANDGRCDMACKGDANEICGGGDGLSVYQLQASVVQSYKTWSYANCYEDSINDRKIPNPGWVSGPMTVEGCLEACYNDGYTVAGLEWSQECYCGYNLPPQVATDNRCDMSCKGDSSEICGGGNGLTVYQRSHHGPHPLDTYKSWTYDNCYVDSRWDRVLPVTQWVDGLMTIEKCLNACDHSGYEYAGVEYGKECYCGRHAPTQVANDGRCDMACEGNDWEQCGGGNGIDIYHSCDPNNSPHRISYHNGWKFEGCFVDSTQNRVLPIRACEREDGQLTIEKCLESCHNIGYDYAGLEYGHECWCGSSAPPQPATDGRCDMTCSGDDHEYCGGGDGIDVYSYHQGGEPGHIIQGDDRCPPQSITFTTTYVAIQAVETTFTFTTTIIEPTTGVTTVAVPVAATATVSGTAFVPTTVPQTETELTTITLPVTATRTIFSAVPVITTIPVPVTATSTATIPFVATTTITKPFTTITTVIVPTTTPVLTTIPAIITTRLPTTFVYPSATLSIYTGTTSFVDPITTIYQPIIILTTLVRTITTTGLGPNTIIPTVTTSVRTLTTDIPVPTDFITTTYDFEPVTGTSFVPVTFTSTSFDIEPTVSTSTDVEEFITDTVFTSDFTETVPFTTTLAVPTETLSDFTTTSFETAPAVGTFATTSTTTVTTTFQQTFVGTTTVTTAPASSSA